MKASKCYYVIVVTDQQQNGNVIGTATLILEQKFIRKCALKGRVEEVCSNQNRSTRKVLDSQEERFNRAWFL